MTGFAACGFSAHVGVVPSDSIPDAGLCTGASKECIGDTFRECRDGDSMAHDRDCTWGCATSPEIRCIEIDPAGSAVTSMDLAPTMDLLPIELEGGMVIDGDDGRIGTNVDADSVRAMGSGIISGIDYQKRANNISVFRFRSLRIKGALGLTGTRAIALVADGDITVEGIVDARGVCTAPNPGPGGSPGGPHDTQVSATSTGASSDVNRFGGGGGGHFGTGGVGKGGQAGGVSFGDEAITILAGGGGGGGGGGGNEAGDGGGGGGGIQLVSNGTIIIRAGAGINAGGCGGETGRGGEDAGGGGGAGGTILLEASIVRLDGALGVNGGGGGGGDAEPDSSEAEGEKARIDQNVALGFPGPNAAGGHGGANMMFDGAQGTVNAGTDDGGGGGGAVGRIRITTRTGNVMIGGTASLSPPMGTGATTFAPAKTH